MSQLPNITLHNGIEMPMLGLGVYLAPADRTACVVADALSPGYRLIDTAAFYGHESGGGEGIRRSGIDRTEKRTQANVSDRGTTLVEYRHG
jgi:diketogulonate reductase-like aldo/keto reductase